jgi:DNA polymerase-3 subunit alpha (Gram-positive type)
MLNYGMLFKARLSPGKAFLILAASLVTAAAGAFQVPKTTFVAFDIETTGFSGKKGRIVEIGVVKFRGGEIIEKQSWLVNPGIPIPPMSQQVHGITDAMVTNAPAFKEVYPQFAEFIDDAVLVAHNAGFDIRFIEAETKRNAFDPPDNDVIDTLKLSRKRHPEIKRHGLESLSRHFSLGTQGFHRGLTDAVHVKDLFLVLTQDDAGDISDLLDLAGRAFKKPDCVVPPKP